MTESGEHVAGRTAPRRTTVLIAAAVAVVVVGAGIGSYFAFFHGSGAPAAQVVSDFTTSYTALERNPTHDTLSAFENYLCPTDRNAAQAVYGAFVTSNQPGDPSVTVTQSGLKVDGARATFTLTITEHGEGSFSAPGHLVRQGGDWQVCQTIAGH